GTLMCLIPALYVVGAGIGGLLSGWMAEHWGFGSVFWLICGVGAVDTAVVAMCAPGSKPSDNVRMDWIGAAVLVVSVLSITLAANEAGKGAAADWLYVIGLVAAGLIVFAIFWRWETRQENTAGAAPLVAPKYLRRRETWG